MYLTIIVSNRFAGLLTNSNHHQTIKQQVKIHVHNTITIIVSTGIFFIGLMETGMQGLLEQAPPEILLTDLTLNYTALSFRPTSTSSQGVAASPIDSTQALLGKDWESVTLPGNNTTLPGDVTFPRDSVMVTGEGEKSLIYQLSINKTVDCDVTQVSNQYRIFLVPLISFPILSSPRRSRG